MTVKPCASLLLCGALAFAEGQLDVSGTVKSAAAAQPLSGAVVHLAKLGTSATTDAQGRFALSGPTSVKSSARAARPEGIAFRQLADGPVRIRVANLAGAIEAEVFSGNLAAGAWTVQPPALSAGIHLCVFETPSGRRTERFAAKPSKAVGAIGVRPDLAYASRAAADPVDTLVVSKTGYRTARVALETYQKTGLEISLEDSSGSDISNATIVPDASWPCFMADGIPPPGLGTAAFQITLQIGAIHDVGQTKFGLRRQYDIKGGTVKGDKIDATALSGGLDYQLKLSTGSMEIEQIVILKAGNTPILMRNAGVAPAGASEARMVLDFEAPNSSSYTWLHTGKFVATRVVDTVAKTIRLDVREVSKATLPAARVVVKDPAGVSNQTWDCPTRTGAQGTTVFTAKVTLGASVSIGATKRGSRNIIPITGGTLSGKVVGKVLNGGADYQLGGLDARYTLQADDGEYIVVRNCGPGSLYPVFETRTAGKYAYLNENKYASSGPGMITGGVSITYSEIK